MINGYVISALLSCLAKHSIHVILRVLPNTHH